MTRRRALSALLIAVAIMLSAGSALVHRDFRQANSLFLLFPMQLLALPLAGAVAGRCLRSRSDVAPGVLGVGLYLLMVAGAISTIYPVWLPEDDTILGSALLAGMWAGVGANLALASAAILGNWPSSRRSVFSGIAGILAFLLVTLGPIVSPVLPLEMPLVTIGLVAIAALLIAHEQGFRLLRPVALALAGGVGTLAVIVGRGPGDWASASTSLKLYSFPILLMAIGVSMALVEIVRAGKWPLNRTTQA